MFKNFRTYFCLLFLISFVSVKGELVISTNTTLSALSNQQIIIPGKADLHITSSTCKNAMVNSTIDLQSSDSWVIFDNIKPSVAADSLLKYITVNGNSLIKNSTVRVSIYKNGSAIIPHRGDFQPLTLFAGKKLTGDSVNYSISTYYKGLGSMDNKARSFRLKRGYMVTLASGSAGNGYSRVFIADKADLIIDSLDYRLDQVISFVRVFKWQYVSKKGKAGWNPNDLDATTYYDWNIGGNSSDNVEYVAIRQNGGWPSWTDINNKQNITHVLGFNEPDHTDQSNMTMQQIMDQWPSFMNSGLRIGSPAWASAWGALPGTEGGNLFDFIKKCDALNYRVDFVALHCYWGGKSPQSWYNDLKYIHELTGRPLWITEWNNGANWTTEWWPDGDHTYTTANAAKQYNDIRGILQVLDTASFIERYFIYDWVQDCRAMVLGGGLTQAGTYYKQNKSNIGFTSKNLVVPDLSLDLNPSLTLSYSTNTIGVSVNDKNSDYCMGFILEKKVDDGNWEVVLENDNRDIKNYSDTLDLSKKSVKYRTRTKLANGRLSNYTPEVGFHVATGQNFQYGNMKTSNGEFSSIFYSQAYTDYPAIIAGGPRYTTTSTLVTPRVKFVNKTQRFTLQAAPWQYQNASSFADEIAIPYLSMYNGVENLGGLTKDAGRTTVSASDWTTINFNTTFANVPVVFANSLLSSTTYPTVVRIKDVTTTGFKAMIFKEAAVTTAGSSETITWAAIEPGEGVMDNQRITVGKTSNSPVNAYYKLVLPDSLTEKDVFIAQFQTKNDAVTANLGTMLYKGAVYLMKQAEKSAGSVTAKSEDAGWIYINPDKLINSTPNISSNAVLRVYPNPATDQITITGQEKNETVSVYNMYGQLIRSLQPDKSSMDINDLPAGYYLLKTNSGTAGFLKN